MLKYFLILVLRKISTSPFFSRGPHYVICHKAGVAGMFGEATIQIRLHLKKNGMAIGREGSMTSNWLDIFWGFRNITLCHALEVQLARKACL